MKISDSAAFSPSKSRLDPPSVHLVTPDETPLTPRSWPTVYTHYIHRTQHVSLKMSPSSSQPSRSSSPLPVARLFPSTPNLQKAQRRSSAEACRRAFLDESRSHSIQPVVNKRERETKKKAANVISMKSDENPELRAKQVPQSLTSMGKEAPEQSLGESISPATTKSPPAPNNRADLESVPVTVCVVETSSTASAQLEGETGDSMPRTRIPHPMTFVVAVSVVGLGIFLYRAQQQQQHGSSFHLSAQQTQHQPPQLFYPVSENASLPPPLPTLRDD